MTSLALYSGVYVLRVMVSSPFRVLVVFYHVHDIFSSGGLKLRDHYILVDCRADINQTPESIQSMNDLLVPLIKEKHPSIDHITIRE